LLAYISSRGEKVLKEYYCRGRGGKYISPLFRADIFLGIKYEKREEEKGEMYKKEE
jgi:hypothetical protein